ncbi:MAG: phosphoribosyltransferase family protein, partial [Patescibacteria group bacterium]
TYKYKFVQDMAAPLSVIAKKRIKRLLSKGFNLFEDNPLLIPVPLRRKRLNWRGFNQAGLLAKNISDAYCMSYRDDILIRIADPKHQADIKAKEDRINNVRNNFTVKDSKLLRGRTVILVDDICTTGATINECAKVLKNPPAGGGAKRVIGFAIARN